MTSIEVKAVTVSVRSVKGTNLHFFVTGSWIQSLLAVWKSDLWKAIEIELVK